MLKISRGIGTAVLCSVTLFTAGTPGVQAQRATTSATISSPLQLAGTLLPAGTYQFALAADRRSVVVSNADRHVVTTLMVVPVSRARRGTVLVTRPVTNGAAPEVSAMYLDGGTDGFEIVRPASRER